MSAGEQGVAGPATSQTEAPTDRKAEKRPGSPGARWKPAKRRPLPPSNVVVSGAGIGGLATALALQRRGVTVKVFERDESADARPQGYGMTMSTTNTALAELGILDELRVRDTRSSSHYIFDQSGAVLGYFGHRFHQDAGRPAPDETKRGNLRVPRKVLRQMLLDRLEPGTVRWGMSVIDFADSADPEGKVTISIAKAATGPAVEEIKADVLVAADGIRSKIRSAKHRDPLKYLGVMAVVGTSRHQAALLDGRGFYTLDGEHRLFTMPYSTGTNGVPAETMWQLTFRLSEPEARALALRPKAEILAEVVRRTAKWHPPCPDLIGSTDPAVIWAHPLYDRDPMPPPKKGAKSRVTFVGDAAHPMSCFKGMGANTALFDGPHLARLLATLPTASALAVYEREMLARSSPRVLASREAAVTLHTPDVLEAEHGIAGVPANVLPDVKSLLASRCVTAQAGAALDDAIAVAIADATAGR